MVEELKSVISLLAREHRNAEGFRGLGVCHQVFLRENNADGFFWSSEFMSGIIEHLSYNASATQDISSELYGVLLSAFCYTGTSESESPEALAAFFVGTRMVYSAQERHEWLSRSYGTAKSQLLRYHISLALSQVSLSYEESLKWLELAKKNATSSDALQVTEYLTGATMLALGNVEGAHGVLAGSFDSDDFSQALSCMLDAEVKNHVSSETSLRERIAAYAEGRKLLINSCMPNFRRELARFISSDSPQRFLTDFLQLDDFSDYLNHELEEEYVMQDEARRPGIQLFSSYFAYKLYRFGRKRMIELQSNVPAEGFMDPRPYFEEAVDEFSDRRFELQSNVPAEGFMDPGPHLEEAVQLGDSSFDMESIVRCLKISLKATGHLKSLTIGADLLRQMSRDERTMDFLCSVVASYFDSSDEENPDALTAYIFSGATFGAVFESYNVELLEKSVELARTPALRALTTLALGPVTDDLEKKLALLEKAKDFAVESGRDDLIFHTGYYLFSALKNAARYAKMKHLREQVVSLQAQYFPRSKWIKCLVQKRMRLIFPFDYFGKENHGSKTFVLSDVTLVDSGIYDYFKSMVEEAPVPFEDCYKYKQSSVQTGNIITLFYNFVDLVNNKLEDAEEAGASLLVMIEANKDLPFASKYITQVLIGLAMICGNYYARDYRCSNRESHHRCSKRLSREVEETVAEVIDSLFTAALASDDSSDFMTETLWSHSVALESLGWMKESIGKMAESMKVRLQIDANFENLSDDRIRHLDDQMYPRFQKLQLALFDRGDVKQSLVWSERQRTRDFSFRLTRLDKNRYLKERVEFDINDENASEVIESAISMMGNETVALMINQFKTREDAGWVYHTYFIHTSKTVACPREVRSEADLALDAKEIESLVKEESTTFYQIFERLHQILLEPFKAEFEEVKPKRIIFIPSKEMSAVPFNLLRNPATGKFLIQEYSIATVSSLRLLRHCFMRKEELELQVQTQTDVLVVGDPTNNLPSASKEAGFVAKLLKERIKSDVTFLHQPSATKEAVLKHLPGSDWFHIASHAVVDQEFPDGALLLAPRSLATDRSPSPEDVTRALRAADESEKLVGEEIVSRCGSEMKARGGVLGACTSGVGRQSAEGILAFPRSFHLCGVPSMVVSLWKVYDQATEKLMQLFYTKLIEGEEIADALRLAMLEMLEDDFRYSIYDWAPFTLSGCPTTRLQINNSLLPPRMKIRS